MLAFYMAYSADHKAESVYALAGILANTDEWFELEKDWEQRLKQDGLDYFRPYECKSLDGEFEKLVSKHGLTTARVLANALMQDMKAIVHRTIINSYFLGISMPDYRKAVSIAGSDKLQDDPYFYSHQQLITLVTMDFKARAKKFEPIAFMYDERQQSPIKDISWSRFKELNFGCSEYMGTIAPADDKKTIPLQAAHLIANMAGDICKKHFGDNSATLAEIKEVLPGFRKGWLTDKDYLMRVIDAQKKLKKKPKSKKKK